MRTFESILSSRNAAWECIWCRYITTLVTRVVLSAFWNVKILLYDSGEYEKYTLVLNPWGPVALGLYNIYPVFVLAWEYRFFHKHTSHPTPTHPHPRLRAGSRPVQQMPMHLSDFDGDAYLLFALVRFWRFYYCYHYKVLGCKGSSFTITS